MRQLQYAEDVVKRGFAGFNWQNQFNDNFADDRVKTVQQQVDYIFNIANNCRGEDYKPLFTNDKEVLPVQEITPKEKVEAVVTIVPVKEEELKSTKALTEPPKQQAKQDELLNAVLIGLGVIVVLKILS